MNFFNYIKLIQNTHKINKEYKNIVKITDDNIKRNVKFSNYNSSNDFLNSTIYCVQLKDYLKKEILYVYILAKNTNFETDTQIKKLNQEMYGNTLCRNLCSFIDLYLQILNIFYDLGLKQLRKDFNPSLNNNYGIVDQAINKNIHNNNSNVINWSKLKKKIEEKYVPNEYYIKIKKLIEYNDDIKAMKLLRNYNTHNQALFSKFRTRYDKNQVIMEVNYEELNPQYDKFINLAYRVIRVEIDLIIYFENMCFYKKMLPKNTQEKNVYIFKCKKCQKQILISPSLKKLIKNKHKIYCANCKKETYLIDLKKTITVHPEKYYEIIKNELQNVFHS